jgi:hypothetical protein
MTPYTRRGWVIVVVSLVVAVAVYFLGDGIYRTGVEPYSAKKQLIGWSIGFLGISAPWTALRSYSLWLRDQRRLWQPARHGRVAESS